MNALDTRVVDKIESLSKRLEDRLTEIRNTGIKINVNDTNINSLNLVMEYCFASKALFASKITLLELKKDIANCVLAAVHLRQLFELLIQSRLCHQFDQYKISFYYLHTADIRDTVESLNDGLNKEISRLQNAEVAEKERTEILLRESKLTDDLEALTKQWNRNFEDEFGLFNCDSEINGLDYQAHIIETQYKPPFHQQTNILKAQEAELYSQLFKEPYFQSAFPNVTCASKVFDALKNVTTDLKIHKWKGKAAKAQLSTEYDLLYRMTSNLIHSSAISVFTKVEINPLEKELFLRYTLECLREITKVLPHHKR